jgi:hypothetical protein
LVQYFDLLYLISAIPQVHVASSENEGPDPQLIHAELQGACDSKQSMGLLGKHATSVTSTTNNAPAGLAASDDFQTSYLQPLKIFDTAIEKIANVWAGLLGW